MRLKASLYSRAQQGSDFSFSRVSSSLGCVYTVVVSGETWRAKRWARYRSWVIRYTDEIAEWRRQ
jgi:hypothetical protein